MGDRINVLGWDEKTLQCAKGVEVVHFLCFINKLLQKEEIPD
jgi:hypothetical protein